MLHSLANVVGRRLLTRDGSAGRVEDLYFDDELWKVQYVVVQAGTAPQPARVLIDPHCLSLDPGEAGAMQVTLSCRQLRNSPEDCYSGWRHGPAVAAKSISAAPESWKRIFLPYGTKREDDQASRVCVEAADSQESHLRSFVAATHYRVRASDGGTGHISDLLADERSWAIRFLVIHTRKWWGGHEVLVPPEAVRDVNWADCLVHLNLSREMVDASPIHGPATPKAVTLERRR